MQRCIGQEVDRSLGVERLRVPPGAVFTYSGFVALYSEGRTDEAAGKWGYT